MVKFSLIASATAALATLTTALPVLDQSATGQLAFSAPSSPSSLAVSTLVASLDLARALDALPHCHRSKLDKHIASLPEVRLVKLAEDDEPLAITEGQKALLTLAGKRFVDVTDEEVTVALAQENKPFPDQTAYKVKDLQPLFDDISLKEMEKFLRSFSGFRNRYYRSDTGKQSQQFLLGQIKQIVHSRKDLHITIREFEHPWGQNSIIVRLEPKSSSTTSEDIVILSAHQDSTNLLPFLPAPGADDDGSGTTSLLAAFSSLVNAGFVPSERPVELHWYSAEEGGLLGSQAVAQEYAKKGVKVRAMMQNDMSAFVKAGTKPHIGLFRDYTDPALTEFIATVIDEYATIPRFDSSCGYACSDNGSWFKLGYPSSFIMESRFEESSKNIHSTKDTIDYSPEFSFEHMREFSRIDIALAIELGGGANLFK
ncbi:hypothetical protein JCM8097_006936 [Rhodosporidiobolus ruineniae]